MPKDKAKQNEIIEEQKKSRKAYLELKKMQRGEMSAGPKPSEVAIVPKTFGEKCKHFWYYNKKIVFVSIFLVVVITFMTVQCALQPKFDLQVVVFTYDFILDENTDKMAEYFEKYCDDINGDGKVIVKVINCSFDDANDTNTYKKNKITRLQQVMGYERTAMLYITDNRSIDYFKTLSDNNEPFFEDSPIILGKDFYDTCGLSETNYLDSEIRLSISCRKIDGTLLDEDHEETKTSYKYSKKILERIIEDNKSQNIIPQNP